MVGSRPRSASWLPLECRYTARTLEWFSELVRYLSALTLILLNCFWSDCLGVKDFQKQLPGCKGILGMHCRGMKEACGITLTVLTFHLRSWFFDESISFRLHLHFFSNEKSAQRGNFGADIPADIRPKASVKPSKSWKQKHFGTDIPRRRPWKKLRSEKPRADFCFPYTS